MKKLGKLENVTLLKIGVDFDLQFRTYQGWEMRGVAWYKIGFRFYKVSFIYLSESDFKVAFYEDNCFGRNHYSIPTERLQREALLVLIRGEVEKYLGRTAQINYFKQIRAEEEEERRKKEEEEERKRIALGEQITIEKYLLQ